MTVNQVKKIEGSSPAILLSHHAEDDLASLVYYVTKYGYTAEIMYIFENNKLALIIYDFLADDDSQYTEDEIYYMYTLLNEHAKNEFGKPVEEGADDSASFYTAWDWKGYEALLQVHDREYYATAELVFAAK